jgi:hypothetical protein
MKTGYIIALSIVVAFGLSCTREMVERADNAGEVGIGFVPRLSDVATRGSVVETPAALATKGGFDVWAFTHSDTWAATATSSKATLMDGITVTGTTDGGGATTWSYGEPVDWPFYDRVSFFAYGPSESATVATPAADGTPQVNFSVSGTVTDQKDLLISTPVKDQRGMMYTDDDSKVGVNFKHALARISFSGLLTSATDTRTITVKKITLKGLYGAGSTTLTDPVDWTLSGTANQSYTVSVADATLSGAQFTTQGVSLTADGNYLFLMPQTVVRTVARPTMDVTLIVNGKEVTYQEQSLSPAVWKAGYSYNYQLTVTANDLRIIVVDTALSLEPFDKRIVENVIFLSTDKDEDATNLAFAMNAINSMNTDPLYAPFPRYGLYAVGNVSHDITLDIGTLLSNGGTLTGSGNFTSGQYLILDLRKHVPTGGWHNDPVTGTAAKVEITNYSTWWNKLPSKQLGGGVTDVDAATGATTQTPADVITSRGVFILQRK